MANTKQNRSTSSSPQTKQQNAVGQQPQQSSQKLSGFSQLSQQWDKTR